jgi:hypothetical protein
MRCWLALGLSLSALLPQAALAWGNHSLATYRAFEKMPELVQAAPVTAETLESFLRAEELALEALLAADEAWARAKLEGYPVRPASLAFTADPARPDAQRRLAFLKALRVALDSRFALYIQPDPQAPATARRPLPNASVDTLPQAANATQRFVALKAAEPVSALAVLASASDEPDYGLDINCWEDSPGDWGKTYGFGPIPFGNPALSYATQAPFHMGFYHQDRIVYMAAPFVKRTYPLLRAHQFASLAALAFRTGHPYWGWRFTGLSLHYVQDLTQPYHANMLPGVSLGRMLFANALAIAGLTGMKNDMIVLVSNRHLALERYEIELLQGPVPDAAVVKALQRTDRDAAYPPWSDNYLRDVVAEEAYRYGDQIDATLVAAMPAKYVSDPTFDFGANWGGTSLRSELARSEAPGRARLDAATAELLGRFGAHSRNAVRAILRDALTR